MASSESSSSRRSSSASGHGSSLRLSDTTSSQSSSVVPPRSPIEAPAGLKQSLKPPKNMNGPLYMQNNEVVLVRRRKRKNESPTRQLTRWFVENQIGLSFNLLTLLVLVHVCLPKARANTSKFFTLSYYNPDTGLYGVGSHDGYFIFFSVVLLTALRAATMDFVLAPSAQKLGIAKRKIISRFSEQGWLLIFYTVFWGLGVSLYVNGPHYFNNRELWTNWPGREITGTMKMYILAQLGFWMQQVMVINIEERRKDHWQMFTHHVITIVLLYASYRFHFTRIGNLILILMDIGDLVFAVAKCLRYIGCQTACDVAFGVFMLSWFVFRHIFFNMAVWSIWADSPEIIPLGIFRGNAATLEGPFDTLPEAGDFHRLEPLWKSDGMIRFDGPVRGSFIGLLCLLQVLAIVWFGMIVRVAVRVLKGEGADDSRSDDEGEGEDEDEDEYVYEEAQPLEEEVGVEELDLKSWERRTGVKRQASTTTGVSLPGHSDRKELLGRIGCEKQVD